MAHMYPLPVTDYVLVPITFMYLECADFISVNEYSRPFIAVPSRDCFTAEWIGRGKTIRGLR